VSLPTNCTTTPVTRFASGYDCDDEPAVAFLMPVPNTPVGRLVRRCWPKRWRNPR